MTLSARGRENVRRRRQRGDIESIRPSGGGRFRRLGYQYRPPWMGVLHRVPPQLREGKKHVYDPSVLSLGPYHHGQPQCRPLEEFKDKVVKLMLKEEQKLLFFRKEILKRIDSIRHFYGGESREMFDDEVLAEMMLLDACTVLFLMDLNAAEAEDDDKVMLVWEHLGLLKACLMTADIVKLENQILGG